MNRKHLFYTVLITGATAALTLALTLTLSSPRSHPTPAPADSPALAKASSPASQGGPLEAIKVHGHWTIDVRNPDGKLATHREFENAFNNPNLLGGFLARKQTPGQWIVILQGNVCSGGPAFPNACIMDELGGTLSGAVHTLTSDIAYQVPLGGIGLLLKGQAEAVRDGTINAVQTKVTACPPDVTPMACGSNGGGGAQFSGATLPPPPENGSCPPNTQCAVGVRAGQIIQISVVISFS